MSIEVVTPKLSNCPCCRKQFSVRFQYKNEFLHDLFDHRHVILCDNCGFGSLDSYLGNHDLSEYYRDVYRAPRSPMHIDFSSLNVDPFQVEHRSFSQISLASNFFENREQPVRFLDIGAGPGQSFRAVRSLLRNASLYAIEENEDAKQFYHRHFGVHAFASFEQIENGFFDIVLMSHSLEHFQAPDLGSVLNKIYDLLKPGGILLIEVPHVDFRNGQVREFRVNDTPHTCFFSVESLQRLVANETQFQVSFLRTCGLPLVQLYTADMAKQRLQMFQELTVDVGSLKKIKKSFSRFLKRFAALRLLKMFLRKLSGDSFIESPEEYSYSAQFRENIRLVLQK